jgi:hypothetical protein
MPVIEERVVSNVPRTLPMRLVHCNGGEEGPQYRTSNALVADSSVYSSSARCNIHMLLQSTHALPFTLTHVVVMAPDCAALHVPDRVRPRVCVDGCASRARRSVASPASRSRAQRTTLAR